MYLWLVLVHLVGIVVFVAAHGVSMFVAFRLRGARERSLIVGLLQLSAAATRVAYVGLVALGIGGLGAAATAGSLTASWVVGSYVVVGLVLGAMYGLASPYYIALRTAIAGRDGAPPAGDDELVRMLDSRRPEILLVTGGIGLVVLVWLMVFKP